MGREKISMAADLEAVTIKKQQILESDRYISLSSSASVTKSKSKAKEAEENSTENENLSW